MLGEPADDDYGTLPSGESRPKGTEWEGGDCVEGTYWTLGEN